LNEVGLLVERVVAKYFGTNCWIIASNEGAECVVVDPGIGIPNLVSDIRECMDAHNLKPAAILITHGHLDHVFSVVPLQSDCGIQEVIVHSSDLDLISRPERGLGPQGLALMKDLGTQFGLPTFEEPSGVREVGDSAKFELAGMKFSIVNTPGHTPGSLIAIIDNEYVITGDTLFKGAIGRTDLPRGSISDMERTLREKIATLPGHLEVLPGHGEKSRMEDEIKNNPYILAAVEGRLG
jgi:hydroxyacylglutathione hydrolase